MNIEGEIWYAELVWNKEALWIPLPFITPILQDKLCRCPTQVWLVLQRIRGWVSIQAQALLYNRNTVDLWKSSCQHHSHVKILGKVPTCIQRDIQIEKHHTLLRYGEYVYKEDVVYIMEYYLSIKKDKVLTFAIAEIDLKGIPLSAIRQTKTYIVWFHLYVASEKWNKWINKTEIDP